MQLTYTYIRLDDGRRLIVPNERLASSSVENHTIVEPRVQVEVSVWLPPDADLDKAIELIADEDDGISVSVAETDKEGVRLSATTWASSPARARRGGGRAAAAMAASAARARTILSGGLLSAVRRPTFPMTHRQRKQGGGRRHGRAQQRAARRSACSPSSPSSACSSLVGYVLAIAATAPDLDELKPIDKGQTRSSTPPTARGSATSSRTILRRVIPWSDIPVDLRRATVAIEDERFYKHHGVDFEAHRARRRSRTSSPARPCRAARRSPSSSCARSTSRTRSATSSARSARPSWPRSSRTSTRRRWILHNYLNAVPYGTVGGATAIGVEAAAVTFFAKHAQGPDAGPVRAARRPAAGAVASTTRSRTRRPRSSAATRCCEKMAENGYITQAEATQAAQRAARAARAARATPSAASRTSSTTSQEQLIERYGVGVVPPRRPARPHDDRPEAAGRRPRTAIERQYYADPATRRRRSSRSTRATATSARWRRAAPTSDRNFNLAAQGHRQPGSAFKTFVLTDGDPQGRRPGHDLLHLEAARPRRPGVRAPGRSRPSATATSARVSLTRATLRRTTRSTRS